MPMSLSHVADHWNQQRESIALVGLENCEEIVVFEEAHSSVSNLKVKTSNTLYQSFE